MKRILALSGGGVRGAVEVAFLEAIEAHYRKLGHDSLADVYDLVGGTSTGALVATAISLGQPVSEIARFYTEKAPRLFGKSRGGLARLFKPAFDSRILEDEIRGEVGDLTLGAPELRTYLGIVTKRLDTGAPWILSNIPSAPYFEDDPAEGFIGNKHYELAKLLRASSAAPTLFQQQTIKVAPNEAPGVFVDGGASPYNDPSMALLLLARAKAFGLEWPLGVANLSITSVGTGTYRRRLPREIAAKAPPWQITKETLLGMINDNEAQALTMMQWMGQSPQPERLNSEIGTLDGETLFGEPAFHFQRLDLPIGYAALRSAGVEVTEAEVRRFETIEDPKVIPRLMEVTRAYCANTYDLDALLV
ncbi:MAG: patatin-like phospholipase family protein [Pseudomonadota bacterium]